MSFSRKPAAIAASLALLGGCGGAAFLATDADASTPTTSSATAEAHHHGSAATGSATVSLTGPKGKTRTRTVPVSCKVVDNHYILFAGKKLSGSSTAVSLDVKDYTGAGNYTGKVTFVHRGRYGFSSRHLPKVPVTVTSTGGSFKWSKTLTGKRDSALAGKTVSATASWTCSV